ncbi:uncharacterized protein LOC134210052 [Armigeres subalbatus]|uniref:uncharacterized protein LOC134210052 n=1 Tax=Armigeres subalbatus TaxID=124917 RepID=UPI002ED12E55
MAPKSQKEIEEMKRIPFKEAVGCLSFVAQITRPDIAYALNAVSQFSSNPGRQHWEAVKKIMRYLKRTSLKKLEYTNHGPRDLVGFSDADWGGDPDNRKSTTGYVFTLQGGAISWNVKKQPTVALSSCKAEYMALSCTIQEPMRWNNSRSQMSEDRPIFVKCDNQAAISIANNGSYNPRTKHVSIRYHFVHDSLEQGVVQLDYLPTKEQPADGFTKPLAVQKQRQFCELLGVSD